MATSMTQVCKEHDNGCDYGCPVCNWEAGILHERREITQMLEGLKAAENPDIMGKVNVLLDMLIAIIQKRTPEQPTENTHE